jgi:hypothetical protein
MLQTPGMYDVLIVVHYTGLAPGQLRKTPHLAEFFYFLRPKVSIVAL